MKKMRMDITREKSHVKKQIKRVIAAGFCMGISMATTMQSIAGTYSSAVLLNTAAVAGTYRIRSSSTGDFWTEWTGDLSFLSGERGNGTKEKPYQISTKEQLMGLSELAAKGMIIEEKEGTYPGNYSGAHFELVRNLDLGGMEWMPIGFYRDEYGFYSEEVYPFIGHFDGNGKTISNFRLSNPEWKQVGLFGVVEDAVIENLKVRPGFIVYGDENAGVLVGSARNSEIRNIEVSGSLKATGTVGGLAGEVEEGTVIENCIADHIALDSGEEREVYAGGLVGKAAESLIVDCVVNTGDSYTARIQGGGHVGGIAGFQNGTDIFNVHVMGTIGGTGSQSIGGVTGKYASGKMKVARFEGTIASSGLGSLAHEGTFIGTHDTGFHYRYGTEAGADLAYLFADSEEKIAAGICGSGISDDNSFGYNAHIGFWHGKDNFFTLVQGQNTRAETERYFYEELEKGMLGLIDTETFVRDGICEPDHFAPNAVGRPARGYLVSVLQVDTAANVENYYDVAVLTAKGESIYSKTLDKRTRGAIAAGDIVTVMTAPKNTEFEKYQMDGVPTYTKKDAGRVDMDYKTGGAYTFVMPAHDTEISAVYKKVAAEIRVVPEELAFKVVQERSGNRKEPSIVTEVKNAEGKLIARYLNNRLEEGTKVQDVSVEAIVDRNNDVADSKVLWSVDDCDLLILKPNEDEDSEGYTSLSASVELNLQADFFQDIIRNAEKVQAENQYRYRIPDTVYGNGTQGGLAVLTAKTRPSSSFEGKPVAANCRVPVTFQIKDHTFVASEGAQLDKPSIEFVVTRKLTGNRRAPTETISVTEPQSITAAFTPDYFDKKEISWSVDENAWIKVDGEDCSASISAFSDAKWIRDIIAEDQAAYKNDWKTIQKGSGKKEAIVTVKAEDMLGHSEFANCQVTVRFETVDGTYLYRGGSYGGSSSSVGSFSDDYRKGTRGIVIGDWKKDESGGWKLFSGNAFYRSAWVYAYNPYAKEGQSPADWFKFDKNGCMLTGWHTDEDGNVYYLWPEKDGTQGHMLTGWNWIRGEDGKERCYYLNPVSDGTRGRLYRNEITPDGYRVNENGAWEINGVVQIR